MSFSSRPSICFLSLVCRDLPLNGGCQPVRLYSPQVLHWVGAFSFLFFSTQKFSCKVQSQVTWPGKKTKSLNVQLNDSLILKCEATRLVYTPLKCLIEIRDIKLNYLFGTMAEVSSRWWLFFTCYGILKNFSFFLMIPKIHKFSVQLVMTS